MLTLNLTYTFLMFFHADLFFKICTGVYFISVLLFLLSFWLILLGLFWMCCGLFNSLRLLFGPFFCAYNSRADSGFSPKNAGIVAKETAFLKKDVLVLQPLINQLYIIHLKISKEEFFYGNAYTFSQ